MTVEETEDQEGKDNRAQFENLLWPFLEDALRLAYRLTGDHQDAEDVVQQSYLKAFRYFASFRAGTNARAWLLWIVRNQSYDALNARRRKAELALAIKELMQIKERLANEEPVAIGSKENSGVTEISKVPARVGATGRITFPPVTRYKIASWLLGIWNSDGVKSSHLMEYEARLRSRIDRYNQAIGRGAETRRGMKYEPKTFRKVGGSASRYK